MANEPIVSREAAENEAAAWIARRDTAEWDAAAFERWLAESVSHRVAYYRLNAAWQEAGRLRALSRGLLPPNTATPTVESTAEPSDDIGLVREHASKSRRRLFALTGSVAAVLIGAIAVWKVEQAVPDRFETVVGGLEAVPLADGSRVTLNTDSEVQVSLAREERVVNLNRGEAYFEVAKEPRRPFVVNAGNRRVVAVGTQFSVRRDGDTIQVIVTEGTVRMEDRRARGSMASTQSPTSGQIPTSTSSSAPGSAESATPGPAGSAGSGAVVLLPAGSVARAEADAVLVQKKPRTEIEQQLSWRSGLLTFRDTPLADAVAEFNRYNERKIVIEDPRIASLQLGGVFRSTNIDPFIELLERGFPVRATQEANRIVLTHN